MTTADNRERQTQTPPTMKALVYEGPKLLNIRDVPLPVLQPGEVLVRVALAGICGSELSGYLGHNSLRKPPLVMGHEFAGVIERCTPGEPVFRAGDRVTVNPLVTCGVCSYCASGRSQLCADRSLLGAHRPGAFAEFVAVPGSNVHLLPDAVSFGEAAYTEPFACAVHIVRLLALNPSDRLIIYGAGPIGLLAMQAAHVFGAGDVVIVDRNEARLEIARELGGIGVTELEQLGPQLGSGFDAAIDAVGAGVTRQACVKAVRRGGRVVFTGLHEPDSALPINDMIREEIMTIGAFAYSAEDFAAALAWIGQGKVNLSPWTVTRPLENGAECFERLIGGPGKIAKYLLQVERR
ncbi:galactitol-1-phosphate 5-dehydrogenase [Paenibacillus sp. GCM10012303]|uniref:galactitol-1-phosphate 5-dehydrogenase n=1 Tax=Paenibacillus sp. GCM10012303 TaxID=3317340 RepID=UPI0036226013